MPLTVVRLEILKAIAVVFDSSWSDIKSAIIIICNIFIFMLKSL